MSGGDRSHKYAADDIPLSDFSTPEAPPSYSAVEQEEKLKEKPSNETAPQQPQPLRAPDTATTASTYSNYTNYSGGPATTVYPPQSAYPPQPYPPGSTNTYPPPQPYPPQPYPQPYPTGSQAYPAGSQAYPAGSQAYPAGQAYPYPHQPYPHQPYPPPVGPDGQPPVGYTYAIPAYPVQHPNVVAAPYHPMNGNQAYVVANQNATTVAVTSSPGHHHHHGNGLACGIGIAWILFIIGWFTIFAWLAGSFFVCLGDKREKRGGIACLIAFLIAAIIITIAIVN